VPKMFFSISDQANDLGIRIGVEQVHPLDGYRLENLGAVQQPLHQENHLEISLLQPVGFAQGLLVLLASWPELRLVPVAVKKAARIRFWLGKRWSGSSISFQMRHSFWPFLTRM